MYKPIMYYSVMTSNRGDMAIRQSIVDAISKNIEVPFTFFNVKYEELTEERILHQLNPDCSMLMIAGSGLYTNYPKSSGWYFPCKTELFSKIKVPIVLLGLGNNKNLKGKLLSDELKPETKQSIKLINDIAKISTVRDQRTYDLLKDIGIMNHELMLDPGNFLNVPYMKKEKRVVINVAQHSPLLGRFDGTQEYRNKNLNYFTAICNYLFLLGYTVVFIAHDSLEQSFIIDLKKTVPFLEHINTDNIDLILEEYARCRFSIGVRMHANILSFATGTPFISLYYDVKSIEYMKLIDYTSFGMSIFDSYLDWTIDKIKILDKHYMKYTNKFFDIRQKEQVKFDGKIKEICNIIKRGN